MKASGNDDYENCVIAQTYSNACKTECRASEIQAEEIDVVEG